jgi:hypothetical protein
MRGEERMKRRREERSKIAQIGEERMREDEAEKRRMVV